MFFYLIFFLNIFIPEGGAEDACDEESRETWNLYGEVHHREWNDLIRFANRLKIFNIITQKYMFV